MYCECRKHTTDCLCLKAQLRLKPVFEKAIIACLEIKLLNRRMPNTSYKHAKYIRNAVCLLTVMKDLRYVSYQSSDIRCVRDNFQTIRTCLIVLSK